MHLPSFYFFHLPDGILMYLCSKSGDPASKTRTLLPGSSFTSRFARTQDAVPPPTRMYFIDERVMNERTNEVVLVLAAVLKIYNHKEELKEREMSFN